MTGKEYFHTEIYDQVTEEEQFRQEILLLFVLEGNLKIEINRKEIIQMVLDGSTPKEAICQLLKEKICSKAHEYKNN